MTRDQLLAEKDAEIAFLRAAVERLTVTVDRLSMPPEPHEPSAAALRQRRYRERHPASPSDVTSDVTVLRDPLERVDPPVSSGKDVVTPEIPKNVGTKTLSGSSSQKRHAVTLDMERAVADAAKRGLVGSAFEVELQRFNDYWDSAGWKRKNGPVKDRNATWRSWLDSPYRKPEPAARNGHEPKGYAGLREWNRRMDELEGVTT